MSAIASTSDLSKQSALSGENRSTRSKTRGESKQTSKALTATQIKRQSKNPLGYGHDNLTKNKQITTFVQNAVTEKREHFRHISQVLSGLPWKSGILKSDKKLLDGVMEYVEVVAMGDVTETDFTRLQTAARNVGSWEGAIFTKKLTNKKNKALVRARRTITRKLLLVEGDKAIFPPLALADQARFFAKINNRVLARYLSGFTSFIAFDMAASHVLPQSTLHFPLERDSAPYSHVPLDNDVVQGYENLLGDYQSRIATWLNFAANPIDPGEDVGRHGVYDMIKEGYQEELEGVTICNLGIVVLALQYFLKDHPVADSEYLLASMRDTLMKASEEDGHKLPGDFFAADKDTDCCVAFLCAALISPLTLLTGQRLYGQGAAMAPEWPCMIWQQLAYVERPKWVSKRERQVVALLWKLVWAGKDVNGLQIIIDTSREWLKEDTIDPPNPDDADFFRGLITSIESVNKDKNRAKKDKKKGRIAEDGEEELGSDSGSGSEDGSGVASGSDAEDKEGFDDGDVSAGKDNEDEDEDKGSESAVADREPLFLASPGAVADRTSMSNEKSGLAPPPVPRRAHSDVTSYGGSMQRADSEIDVDMLLANIEHDGTLTDTNMGVQSPKVTGEPSKDAHSRESNVADILEDMHLDDDEERPQDPPSLPRRQSRPSRSSSASSASHSRSHSQSPRPIALDDANRQLDTQEHRQAATDPGMQYDRATRATTPLDGARNSGDNYFVYDAPQLDLEPLASTSGNTTAVRATTPLAGVTTWADVQDSFDTQPQRRDANATVLDDEESAAGPTDSEEDQTEDEWKEVVIPDETPASRVFALYATWVSGGQGPLDLPEDTIRFELGERYDAKKWKRFFKRGLEPDLADDFKETRLLLAVKRHLREVLYCEEDSALRETAGGHKRKRDEDDLLAGGGEDEDEAGALAAEEGPVLKKPRTEREEELSAKVGEHTAETGENLRRRKTPAKVVESDNSDSVVSSTMPHKDQSIASSTSQQSATSAAASSNPASSSKKSAAPATASSMPASSSKKSAAPATASSMPASSSKKSAAPASASEMRASSSHQQSVTPAPVSEKVRRAASRRPSRQPSVPIKIEKTYVARTLTEARSHIKRSWKSMPSHQIASDIEIYEEEEDEEEEEEEEEAEAEGQGQGDGHEERTPMISWGKSFVVTALGGPRQVQGDVPMSDVEEEDEDGDFSFDETVVTPKKTPKARSSRKKTKEVDESEEESEGSDDEDQGDEKEPAPGNAEALIDARLAVADGTGPDPSDSDREYKRDSDSDSDVDLDTLGNDGIPLNIPIKCVNDNDEDLRPVYLYDVRVALPKTVRHRGRTLLKTIEKDMRELKFPRDIAWLDMNSLPEWNDRSLESIDDTMNGGGVIIIRNTDVNRGWEFNMHNAARIRSPAQPVEVQDFCNRHLPTGVFNHSVPLQEVVHPDHHNPEKVYNMLNAPQSVPLVQIPRQSDIDYGTMAWKYRRDLLSGQAQMAERDLDWRIQTGLNWAIISQKHAMSLGHVDTAGVYTAIAILDGIKYWAIRKTALDPGRKGKEKDVDDIGYFVDLAHRDLDSLPGGATEWVAVILFPGDVLIIPPNARHCVFTIVNTMMAGIHFYYYSQLQRSTCGWICSRFATHQISNADHCEFLSIIQAFASFWQPGFSQAQKARLTPEDAVLRTLPHPARSPHGLPNLVSLAVMLVFNDTFSGLDKPYRGLYYDTDRLAFKKIWTTVAQDGYIAVSKLNYDEGLYKSVIKAELNRGDAWDDRWTCAGLGPLLIHVGRAVIGLSELWEKNRDKKYEDAPEWMQESLEKHDDQVNVYLKPDVVYKRVISDISGSLGLDEKLVTTLIGKRKECRHLQVTSMFPKTVWVAESPRKSTRPPGLWDAFYEPKVDSAAPKVVPKPMYEDLDEEEEAEADDESEDADFGKKRRRSKGRKKTTNRKRANK